MPEQLVPVRDRVNFAKLDEVLPLPDLVGIQRESFDWLLNEGLKEVLEDGLRVYGVLLPPDVDPDAPLVVEVQGG